jgi:hypothetical protein
VPFRNDKPFAKITQNFLAPDSSTDQKLEFLCDGQQVVAFGIHPDTHKPYSWHGGEPGEVKLEDLPLISEAEARSLFDDAVKLLADFGYQPTAARPPRDGDDSAGSEDWGYLLANIRGGIELHDSIRDLAAKLIVSGMGVGASVNLLHAEMMTSTAAHDSRWQARYNDIPRAVDTAVEKFGAPADTAGLGEWDAGGDTELPPPRAWLLGNIFARRFMSSLLGEGGVGKTAVRYAQLLSLAIGRPITGDYVFQRCRVLIVSLEDDADELRRRILAVALHYGIDRALLKGWLFLSAPGAGGGKLMTLDNRGQLARGALADKIESVITARKIDIVSIDPFVKTHSVDENANSAIDDVVQVLTDLGAKYDIAVDAPHHISKGPADPGNANRGRGASAMKDAARLVYTLTPMSIEEADDFGVSEEQRRQLIRMDSGKVNITKALSTSKWFRLVGVPLGNATDMYPSGDEVQTVEPWQPPDTWADLNSQQLNHILPAIDGGLPDGNRYTDAPNAADRAAWKVVQEHAPGKTEGQAREIIKTWVKNGVLEGRSYDNPATRKSVNGLWVDPQKRPL